MDVTKRRGLLGRVVEKMRAWTQPPAAKDAAAAQVEQSQLSLSLPEPRASLERNPSAGEEAPAFASGENPAWEAIDGASSLHARISAQCATRTRVVVRWSVSGGALRAGARVAGPSGVPAARLVAASAHTEVGRRAEVRGLEDAPLQGEWTVEGLPNDAQIVVAVGLAHPGGFVSIAHAGPFQAQPGAGASTTHD